MSRRKVKSRVVQKHISSVGEAAAVFARAENNNEQPIVLVPTSGWCCNTCITIPSGYWVLHQKWFKDQGEAPTGFICCWPGYYRVSHIVTRKGISYNHPVANCPTIDNVMVEVDLGLTFQIGPKIEDAKKFIYHLGACNFDELLSAEVEEAIRALVNRVPVMKVLDLREEFALGMKGGLNRTMKPYGVEIKNVKITNVQLPASLEATLQSRTSFETQMEQQEKKHTAEMRKVNDDAAQRLEQIMKENKRSVQDLTAETERAIINREERLTAALNHRDVCIVNESSRTEVAIVEAQSKVSVATQDGKRDATKVVERTRATCDARKVTAEQNYQSRFVLAEAGVDVAKKKAKIIELDANIEKSAATQLADVREFEVQNLRLDVLTGIAKNSNMVITGETGDGILGLLAPGGMNDLSLENQNPN
eukprot:GSMAST32.ASY1.ANO1.612.1 assembled CDS